MLPSDVPIDSVNPAAASALGSSILKWVEQFNGIAGMIDISIGIDIKRYVCLGFERLETQTTAVQMMVANKTGVMKFLESHLHGTTLLNNGTLEQLLSDIETSIGDIKWMGDAN
ncbi:hypothetical protein BGW42_002958 [Actinomortierella wolfii]|nr:hypothetical protein BGW42_002958 [Actinomortierella wolfii]